MAQSSNSSYRHKYRMDKLDTEMAVTKEWALRKPLLAP